MTPCNAESMHTRTRTHRRTHTSTGGQLTAPTPSAPQTRQRVRRWRTASHRLHRPHIIAVSRTRTRTHRRTHTSTGGQLTAPTPSVPQTRQRVRRWRTASHHLHRPHIIAVSRTRTHAHTRTSTGGQLTALLPSLPHTRHQESAVPKVWSASCAASANGRLTPAASTGWQPTCPFAKTCLTIPLRAQCTRQLRRHARNVCSKHGPVSSSVIGRSLI